MSISENDTVLDDTRNPIGTKFTKRVLREVFLLEGGVVAIILGICVIGYTFGTLMIHCVKKLISRSEFRSSGKGQRGQANKRTPTTQNTSSNDPRDDLEDEPLIIKKRPLETDV